MVKFHILNWYGHALTHKQLVSVLARSPCQWKHQEITTTYCLFSIISFLYLMTGSEKKLLPLVYLHNRCQNCIFRFVENTYYSALWWPGIITMYWGTGFESRMLSSKTFVHTRVYIYIYIYMYLFYGFLKVAVCVFWEKRDFPRTVVFSWSRCGFAEMVSLQKCIKGTVLQDFLSPFWAKKLNPWFPHEQSCLKGFAKRTIW